MIQQTNYQTIYNFKAKEKWKLEKTLILSIKC